jgi:hypothetical protein
LICPREDGNYTVFHEADKNEIIDSNKWLCRMTMNGNKEWWLLTCKQYGVFLFLLICQYCVTEIFRANLFAWLSLTHSYSFNNYPSQFDVVITCKQCWW